MNYSYEIKDSWNYFRSLSDDMAQTARYVEPIGQEKVYSIEFAKIIILSCTELESVLKALCLGIDGSECGNIGQYKEKVLGRFPHIVEAVVEIPRTGAQLKPFEGWDSGPLSWWDAYTDVKHTRGKLFSQASYQNALYALSALYISILYYSEFSNVKLHTADGGYLSSDYSDTIISFGRIKSLPDFEKSEGTGH